MDPIQELSAIEIFADCYAALKKMNALNEFQTVLDDEDYEAFFHSAYEWYSLFWEEIKRRGLVDKYLKFKEFVEVNEIG